MKKFLLLLLLLVTATRVFASPPLSPEQIAQKVYDRYVGDDMQMRGSMELISKTGHIRTREFISQRKDTGTERLQLIRFTAPADIAGTSFLTIEQNAGKTTEQHLYLPALKRTRRIVASQNGRSFVNSDFTYEDMQRHPVEEWNYQLEGEEAINGRVCYRLTSTPKDGTNTQYSRILSFIDLEHFMPLKTLFWDKKGKLAKSYAVTSFESVDQIVTETDILMEDHQSEHQTRLKTLEISYNSGLKDSLFTTRALER